MKIQFATNLIHLRKEKNLSQAALAEALGLSQRKISYLETSKVESSLADLWNISNYFDVTVDFLIGKSPY